jgi:hypothetical protein
MQSSRRFASILAFVAALSSVAGPALAALDLNTLGCGAIVDESVFLSADLDCSASPSFAAVEMSSGRLELRGFHLHGGEHALRCTRRCQVVGPGTISAVGESAVLGTRTPGSVRLSDVSVDGGTYGVRSFWHVSLVRSTVTADSVGVRADASATIVDSTISDCGLMGVFSNHGPRLVRSAVHGSGRFGVVSVNRHPAVVDSTVTPNGTDPSCGVSVPCADFLAFARPAIRGSSSCDRSLVLESHVQLLPTIPVLPFPGTSWGVCTLD